MTKLVTASANHTLDVLLELVCVRVQLSTTQEELVRQHYGAVSACLSNFSPHIFPQGSQRLGTTTKPLRQAEFDLDAICKLNIRDPCHPGAVYRLIWDRLWSNKVYRPMMKRMPRCIRLEYAGHFHLDIAPAVPDLKNGGNCILVPDLDANLALDHPENDRWKSTNPQDYAGWFESRCVKPLSLAEKYARAQVDPVPEREPVHAKPALKRSVQLIKRWRDVEYKDRPELAPPSIVLTTLGGHLYCGEQLCTDAVRTILNGIVAQVDSGQQICLSNPAHAGEDICEKWHKVRGSYRDFAIAVTAFRDRWERLLGTHGLHAINEALAELFDETPVQWAVKELAQRQVIQPRENRFLAVDRGTGALGIVGAAGSMRARSNTFFGDGESATEDNRTP